MIDNALVTKKTLNWYLPELDLDKFSSGETLGKTGELVKHLMDYIEKNKRIIYLEWQGEDYEYLEKTLAYGSMILRHFANSLDDESTQRALFEIGTLKGTVESFENLFYEKTEELRLLEANKKYFSSIKHLKDIIFVLETHGSVTHTELCNYLGMLPSTLSEAMKKVLETNLVLSSSAGKFRMYSLSEAGIKYGRLLRKKKNDGEYGETHDLLQTIVADTKDEYLLERIKQYLHKMHYDIDKKSASQNKQDYPSAWKQLLLDILIPAQERMRSEDLSVEQLYYLCLLLNKSREHEKKMPVKRSVTDFFSTEINISKHGGRQAVHVDDTLNEIMYVGEKIQIHQDGF